MEDTNELNDIILNKGNSTSSNKKIILSVATLGIILVIVVMLMNSLSSSGTDNLPQAALPPEPDVQNEVLASNEPLFEDVQVIEEKENEDEVNLDQIAKKLKEESLLERSNIPIEEKIVKQAIVPQSVLKKKIYKQPIHKKPTKIVATRKYYIQVGSFSKYEPDKKFLKSITNLGFNYKYHKVTKNSKTLNKVIVGPFKTKSEAKNARRKIRAKIEPGAFLITL